MSEGNFSPDDQHIIQGAYEHYFRQFEDELKKLSTQRLAEIVDETDSVCEGCHEEAGNQAACSIEYAGLFGCMGHNADFKYPDEEELPGIDAIIKDATESDDQAKMHAEHVLQAIEESFAHAREAAISSIPNFLLERRGYDKEEMIRELREISVVIPQDVPVETIANTFIRHRDRLVAELVDNGHGGSGLESDTLKELQTILSEEGRQGKRPKKGTGGTRRNKRGKRKSVRALLNKRRTQSRGKRKTLRRKHNRKRQTRGYKQRRS